MIWSVLPLVLVHAACLGAPTPQDLEAKVREWLALRREIAAARDQWEERGPVLEDDVRQLETQVGALRESLLSATEEADTAHRELERVERRAERARRQLETLAAPVQHAGEVIAAHEARLPASFDDQIPEQTGEERAGEGSNAPETLPERLQGALARLNGLLQLDARIHLGTAAVELPGGRRLQLDALFLGRAAGFAVAPDGSTAAVGRFEGTTWTWQERPELAARIRTAMDIRREKRAAGLVSLPLPPPLPAVPPDLEAGHEASPDTPNDVADDGPPRRSPTPRSPPPRKADSSPASASSTAWSLPEVPAPPPASSVSEPSPPQGLAKALEAIQSDIVDAREQLDTQSQQITAARCKAADRIRELEAAARELTERLERARKRATATQKQVETVKANAEYREELRTFANSAMVEFRRSFGAALSGARVLALEDELAELDKRLAAPEGHAPGDIAGALVVLAESELTARSAGLSFSGVAQAQNGEELPGLFLAYGPVTYFVPDDGDVPGGVAQLGRGGPVPVLVNEFDDAEAPGAVRALSAGESVDVPVDVSGGAALVLARTRQSVREHVEGGGIVMVPLLVLAGVCLVLAVYKFLALSRLDLRSPAPRVERVLRTLRDSGETAALAEAERLRVPLRTVIREGILHREAPRELLEEVLYERLASQTPKLQRLLAPLAVCATVAPLLGLLGTVTGMIHTFRLITAFGSGNAGVLAAGISEALITTETGLAVAIPALLVHAFLSHRVKRAVNNARQAAVTFVNALDIERRTQDRDPA